MTDVPTAPPAGPGAVHDWPVDHLDGLAFDPLLHRLLREEPVARVRMRYGTGDAWLVTRYEDVKEVTADPRFSRALTVDRPITSMTPHAVAPPGGVGRTDPPEHTALRRLTAKAFNRRRVAALRTRAERVTAELLERMLGEGPPADLTEHLTGPLPERVVADLMGLPADALPRLREWRRVILSSDRPVADTAAVKREIARSFGGLADLRAAQPGDDLFSELVAAERAGALSRAQLVSLSVMVVLNALDQVRNQTSTMVYALLTHPAQLAALRAGPALLPAAVEELLRFIPQRNGVGLPRVATEDVAVGGVRVRAGEAVYVSYLAANRDPAVFAEPDRLDLARAGAPHLAFGHGAHYCVGAALTRMLAETVVGALLRDLPAARLAVRPEEVRWLRGTVNRGPESLPLAW
ncbi:cytochrome P450 [Streptomyces tremellae]|uniref:Cytochrome P450 n=1 Tax=Streptomyces tremellae TaxID=1124239 RepID=A0ABP7G7H8_9ACTN